MSEARKMHHLETSPLWRRMTHTPLRDAVRGRISGRLDYQSLVKSSGLSNRITSVIISVVRKTRLNRFEKVEVARELISHFESGLDAGVEPNNLIQTFGDPKQAAALIRRAVRRRRPIARKSLTWAWKAVAAAVVLVIGADIVLAIRLYAARPNIAHNYLADMNANANSVPDADRAWPLYRESLLVLMPEFSKDQQIAFHPEGENWQETVHVLIAHPDAVETLRQAAAKPGLGYIAGFTNDPADRELRPDSTSPENPSGRFDYQSNSLIEVLLPQLASLRFACKLLVADAFLAAEEGDGVRACRDLIATIRSADHARETPTLISELVGIACLSLACETTTRILSDDPRLLDEAPLTELAHALAAYGGDRGVTVDIGIERYWFRDLVQRLYTDDGHGNGHITDEGLRTLMSISDAEEGYSPSPADMATWPVLAMLMADRKDMQSEYDRILDGMIAENSKPLWEQDNGPPVDIDVDHLMGRSRMWSYRYLPIRLLMPAIDRAATNGELAAMRRDGTLIAIALNIYAQQHDGQWPTSLHDLVPHLLPCIPIDRYDGRPMRYKVVDGEALVYCLGVDCDDDHGQRPEDQRRTDNWIPVDRRNENSSLYVDGDWILWSSAGQGE